MASITDLKDIHIPPTPSIFPLAPGYVILILLLIAIGIFSFFMYRSYRQQWVKREALQLLAELQKNPKSVSDTASQISMLLKQVALAYYPRENVAALQGEAWLDFLNHSSQKLEFSTVQDALLIAPFKPEAQEDLSPLFLLAKAWIKQRRGKCLN